MTYVILSTVRLFSDDESSTQPLRWKRNPFLFITTNKDAALRIQLESPSTACKQRKISNEGVVTEYLTLDAHCCHMGTAIKHPDSRLSVHQLTTNFSPKLLHTLTIYYIHFCLHRQSPLNPTALDGAHTHINSLDIQPIFRTATSSPACCTKTPIRHYLSFYCSVCATVVCACTC